MNESIQKAISKFETQRSLAEAIGVRQAVISHYLNDRRTPSRKVALKLAAVMGGEIPWYDFMSSKDEVIQEVAAQDDDTANQSV